MQRPPKHTDEPRDPQAFSGLVHRHYRSVYGVAFSAVGDWAGAEDLAQDTFLAAWANLPALRNPERFGPWVHRIARNLAKNWLRSAAYRRKLEQRQHWLSEHGDEEAGEENGAMQSERRAAIRESLAALTPKLREAVVLHYLEGNSVAESAEALDTTESAVKKRLQYARARMRDYFEAKWEEELKQGHPGRVSEQAATRFLAAAALGPVDANLARAVCRASAGLLAGLGQGALSTATKGGLLVTAKKAVIGAVCLGLALLGGYSAFLARDNGPRQAGTGPAAIEPPGTPMEIQAVHEKTDGGGAGSADSESLAALLAAVSRSIDEAPAVSGASGIKAPLASPAPKQIADPAMCAEVHGSVVDEGGEPVPCASVTVVASGLELPAQGDEETLRRFADAYQAAMTDEARRYATASGPDGRFSIRGIRYAGLATAEAAAEGFMPSGPVGVVVRPGNRERVTLVLEPGVALEGRVRGAEGGPVADGRLRLAGLAPEDGGICGYGLGGSGWAHTAEDGRFRLMVPSVGLAMLVVDSPTHGRTAFADVPIERGAFAELRYPRLVGASGRITHADGRPATGCTLTLKGRLEQVGLADSSRTFTSVGAHTAIIDENGSYAVTGMDPNLSYTADITDPSGTALGRAIPLPDASPGSNIRWDYVLPDAITLRGRVLCEATGKPVSSVRVCAKRTDATDVASVEPACTDEAGHYELKIFAGAGRYRVTPEYTTGIDTPYGDDFDYSREIRLTVRDTATLDLCFPCPWTRNFFVADESGRPVEGVHLTLNMKRPGCSYGGPYASRTGADGRVKVSGLPAGAEVRCEFALYPYAPAQSSRIAGEPGEELPEEAIVLYERAGFRGTLVDAGGTALAGSRVTVSMFYGNGQVREVRTESSPLGSIAVLEEVPATAVALRIETSVTTEQGRQRLACEYEPIAFTAAQALELGAIVLLPEESE
ncbi:MAG: sigma-70 family RNA polymerase sigma factor [Candidatus Hydrogenedentes bacterium]|nr:sigma-70 family RNA polymerase sigma factor [Candidatus Hydrogenedentota bacterium]